ncbi:MAG: gliding motility-associated C-terminal domain-containing protein [Flavobacteriales bacterium]|nr:gliding motility-associated C-terminal domain-containing protein [Flavobacteriales bacterium]
MMRRWALVFGWWLCAASLPAQDVALNDITSPVGGCMLTNNRNVTVQIFNDETTMLNTPFDVTYIINGPISDSITETISTLILAKSIYTYTFVKKADLSVPGTYTFRAYTNLTGDNDRSNDTLNNYVVASDTFTVGGVVSDSGRFVCVSSNNLWLHLNNYIGDVLSWETSADNINWTTINNTTDSNHVTNIQNPAWYRVIVKNGYCQADTSAPTYLQIDSPSVGGNLTGQRTVCALSNSDTILLNGHRGDVLYWESSVNGGNTWNLIPDTTTSLVFTNLTSTTLFRAVIRNGSCAIITSDTVTITVSQPAVAGTLGDSAMVCNGNNSDTLALTGYSGTITDWEWSTDSGNTWLSLNHTDSLLEYTDLTASSWYRVIVGNGLCPDDTSNAVLINASTLPPAVDAGSDTTIIQGDTIMLSGTCNSVFHWTPPGGLSDTSILDPLCYPGSSTRYYLVAVDSLGCSAIDSVNILVTLPPDTTQKEVIITNTITANHDGINDTWVIQNIELFPEAEVFVYNTHGQPVFQSTAYDNTWDGSYQGSTLPDGTYYYVVRLSKTATIQKGTLTILGH